MADHHVIHVVDPEIAVGAVADGGDRIERATLCLGGAERARLLLSMKRSHDRNRRIVHFGELRLPLGDRRPMPHMGLIADRADHGCHGQGGQQENSGRDFEIQRHGSPPRRIESRRPWSESFKR
jgi:hypothetical protein